MRIRKIIFFTTVILRSKALTTRVVMRVLRLARPPRAKSSALQVPHAQNRPQQSFEPLSGQKFLVR